jgi:diguanylate cyclase (GGDEF)-like protein
MAQTSDNDPELQEKLRALEAVFSERLPERLTEIDAALALCVQHAFRQEQGVATLHRLLHTLAGSAGTFGFVELGTRARECEHALDTVIADDAPNEHAAMHFAEDVREFLQWARQSPKQATADAELPAVRRLPRRLNASLVGVASSDPAIAGDVTTQLEYFGYEVAVVDRADRLTAVAGEALPTAIIIDAPFIDCRLAGSEQIARIRKETGLHVPAIIVSESAGFEARLAAVTAGADGYFVKPVDALALSDRLDALTSRAEVLPYRILIVDDDTETAEYHATILREAGMQVKCLHHLPGLLQAMHDYRPELILMDVYMPACSGIDLARLIRQDSSYNDIPIVFLSGDNDLSRQMHAIESGADDFIAKPVKPGHLVSSIANRIERYRALRTMIMHDSLTGLYNHSAVKEQLARELARARRSGTPLSLAMIDLDMFKRINDTYGHTVGDQVIRALSRLLQQRLRRGDVIGRYGGEEFAVIMPATSADTARDVLDQVRDAFSRILHHTEQQEFGASFSAGLAGAGPHADIESIIRAADVALYKAKQLGRNRIEVTASDGVESA